MLHCALGPEHHPVQETEATVLTDVTQVNTITGSVMHHKQFAVVSIPHITLTTS